MIFVDDVMDVDGDPTSRPPSSASNFIPEPEGEDEPRSGTRWDTSSGEENNDPIGCEYSFVFWHLYLVCLVDDLPFPHGSIYP